MFNHPNSSPSNDRTVSFICLSTFVAFLSPIIDGVVDRLVISHNRGISYLFQYYKTRGEGKGWGGGVVQQMKYFFIHDSD